MLKLPMPPPVWIILGPVFAIASFSVLMAIFSRPTKRSSDEGWTGPFYSNPNDPALFVPKRYGFGYTLNFANPWCWLVFVVMIALVLAPLILSASFVRHLPR
jgi:uncharacterized membrane protein